MATFSEISLRTDRLRYRLNPTKLFSCIFTEDLRNRTLLKDNIVTGKATSKSTSSVIVLKKKKNGPPADINQVRKAAISTNAAISKTYHNNSGDTVVVLENNTSKEAILPVLEREIDQDSFSIVPIKERLPTITIVNIDQEYNKERLLELVKNQLLQGLVIGNAG